MATRTVSAAGGNFTAGATWVGGIAPVAGDDIVANATSGNLTMNVVSPISLIGDNFTGYTGTLAFGANPMIFNSVGATSLIIGSGMNITFTTGHFYIQRAMTLTSNGKAIPLRFNASGLTLTLVGTLTASFMPNQTQGIITGADVILTDLNPVGFTNCIIASGFKMFWRPTSTGTFAFEVPQGYFVFDTTNTISLTGGGLLSNTVGSSTVEFAKTPAWSGASPNFTSGKPNFNIWLNGVGVTNSIIATATFSAGEFQVGGNGGNLFLPRQIQLDTLSISNQSASNNFNILGSGGITASYVSLSSRKQLPTNSGQSPQVGNFITNLRLTSDGPFYFGTMSSVGYTTGLVNLSSYTASVPANVYITNSIIASTSITDINNLGTAQYAYSNQNNTLTRTTGFLSSAAGGAGGSFTFVN
jgi:hypothetical protein